jgi:hypothetical protein
LVFEIGPQGAVVEEFGMACVLDLVTFVAASPTAVLSALSTRLATA